MGQLPQGSVHLVETKKDAESYKAESYGKMAYITWFLPSMLPRFQVLSYKLQVTAAKRRDKALAKAAGHFYLALSY